MDRQGSIQTAIIRLALVSILLGLSGCAILFPEPPETIVVEPEPLPEPVAEAEPEPEPEPEPPPPAPEPEPEPERLPEPRQVEPLVSIVLSSSAPAFTAVADQLAHYLDHYEVYDLSDRSRSPVAVFKAIGESEARAVVTVGLAAAEAAGRHTDLPVVVSQVFNLDSGDSMASNHRAVRVLPPMEQHLAAWRQLDPRIRDIGAVLGHGHEDLIAETEAAARDLGFNFHYAIAASDRETLYLFDRLVREIDGFILFPDNRILSRSVLGEMFGTAARHRVQVAVFNESLLQMGATFSGAAVESDIAATITRVLNEIIDGNIAKVPPVSELNELRLTANPGAMRRLGLDVPSDAANTVADAE